MFGFKHIALLAGLLAAGQAAATAPVSTQNDSEICRAAIARVERAARIPKNLMHAISLVESGRYDAERQANVAWPWTINAEGKGAHFATKAEAIAEVRRLQARGMRSIDVGCMQVNLLHHANAFATLDEAFDPTTNALYAAQFLNQLKEDTESWPLAVQRYHSVRPEKGAPYRAKVDRKLREEHARAAEQQRRDAVETTRMRRTESIARYLEARGLRDPRDPDAMPAPTRLAQAATEAPSTAVRTPETPPINQAMTRPPVRFTQFQAPPVRAVRPVERFIPIQRSVKTE